MTDMPVRTCEALYSGLHSAFAPFGLVTTQLNSVDLLYTYQANVTAVVTVESAAQLEAALNSNIIVAGQQVSPK